MDNVSADLYADDTTLYVVHNSVEMIEHNLQTGLNQLHIWCKSNRMVLNSAYERITTVMLITTCQKRQRLASSNLHLKYSDESLKTISNDKILGFLLLTTI